MESPRAGHRERAQRRRRCIRDHQRCWLRTARSLRPQSAAADSQDERETDVAPAGHRQQFSEGRVEPSSGDHGAGGNRRMRGALALPAPLRWVTPDCTRPSTTAHKSGVEDLRIEGNSHGRQRLQENGPCVVFTARPSATRTTLPTSSPSGHNGCSSRSERRGMATATVEGCPPPLPAEPARTSGEPPGPDFRAFLTSGRRVSNPRPSAWEARPGVALPLFTGLPGVLTCPDVGSELRLSCPFGGDRRDRGAKKALLLGGFQHDNRLSELVRFLRGGASGGVDEVAEPRAARQAAGAVGVARGKVQACRTCGRLTRASAPLSDNDRRPGAGTACTASGSECSRFTPK